MFVVVSYLDGRPFIGGAGSFVWERLYDLYAWPGVSRWVTSIFLAHTANTVWSLLKRRRVWMIMNATQSSVILQHSKLCPVAM